MILTKSVATLVEDGGVDVRISSPRERILAIVLSCSHVLTNHLSKLIVGNMMQPQAKILILGHCRDTHYWGRIE